MRTDRALLMSGAVLEGFAGLSLVVAPRITVVLLLGAELDSTGMMTARLTAIALLALGLACWGEATDGGGPARSATFKAITLYNLGDAVFLIAFAASGKATGLFVWAVGLLHLALAVGFIACMRASERAHTPSPDSGRGAALSPFGKNVK